MYTVKPVRLRTDTFDEAVTSRYVRDVRQIIDSAIDQRPVWGGILRFYGFDDEKAPQPHRIQNDQLQACMVSLVSAARQTQSMMRHLNDEDTPSSVDMCWASIRHLKAGCAQLLLSLGYERAPAVSEEAELRSGPAAKFLGCTPRHVQRLARLGRIAGRLHPDGTWRYKACSIYSYRNASQRRLS